jgi:sirohydrochlorin cobaltochelatase
MADQGLVLFAHGARDPRWAEPFVAVAERVRNDRPGVAVTLAFLEGLPPDLCGAVREQAARGVTRIRVVPLFFGRGGHLREDFPRVLEAARAAVPGVTVEVSIAAGESPAVQSALAAFALQAVA